MTGLPVPRGFRRRAPRPVAPSPRFAPGDPVTWGRGRHEGIVTAILPDGRLQLVDAGMGRYWRLEATEVRRA